MKQDALRNHTQAQRKTTRRALFIALSILLFAFYPANAQSVELQLPDISGDVGDQVTIPVTAANIAGKGVASFVIGISYDPAILRDDFSVSTSGTIAAGVTPLEKQLEGEYRIVYARPVTDPIDDDGILLNLNTTVIGEGTTALEISSVSYMENSSGSVDYVTVGGAFSTEAVQTDPGDGEDGVPNRDGSGTGDGNGDGTPDSEQAHVISLLNATDDGYVTVASEEGTTLRNVAAVATPPAELPVGVELPDGILSFEVAGLTAGGSTTVTIYTTRVVTGYFKYGPTPDDPTDHWYAFEYDGTTGAEILEDRVVLHFVDGARGDSDLAANGVIHDPGAPAVYTEVPTSVEDGELPGTFQLRGNYPNPFNPATTVRFDLPESAHVRVDVFDVMGRQVLSVPSTMMQAGANQTVRVDAGGLTSGTYVYRVMARTVSDVMTQSGRMTLVK